MNKITINHHPASHSTKPATVLCIDDDPNVAEAIQLWLYQYDIKLMAAEFGMHGVELATQHRPDAIITDVRMPQGDGEHIVARLKQSSETCDIPIIVLTGSKDRSLQARLTQLGIHQFLTKPVSWQVLKDNLFNALAQASRNTSLHEYQHHLT